MNFTFVYPFYSFQGRVFGLTWHSRFKEVLLLYPTLSSGLPFHAYLDVYRHKGSKPLEVSVVKRKVEQFSEM